MFRCATIYRTVQEALTNIARHARAKNASARWWGVSGSALEGLADASTAKALVLRWNDHSEPLAVRADENRLQQVFRNVLSDAIKFTDRAAAA